MSTEVGKRRFVAGDEEPRDVRAVDDAFGVAWLFTAAGWYPTEGAYDRKERSWWWLTMNRAPLLER